MYRLSYEGFHIVFDTKAEADNYALTLTGVSSVSESEIEQKSPWDLTVDVFEVEFAKRYLTNTDWVSIKINELVLLGHSKTELIAKYADVLTKRDEARQRINNI